MWEAAAHLVLSQVKPETSLAFLEADSTFSKPKEIISNRVAATKIQEDHSSLVHLLLNLLVLTQGMASVSLDHSKTIKANKDNNRFRSNLQDLHSKAAPSRTIKVAQASEEVLAVPSDLQAAREELVPYLELEEAK